MASSSAFYTFIAQEKRGLKFYYYYAAWIFIQFLILLCLVLFIPRFIKEKIWLGHSRYIILLAFLASFSMNQLWKFVEHVGESIRNTLGVQIRNVILSSFYLISVLFLAHLELITIKMIFILNIFIYFFVAAGYAWRLYGRHDFYAVKDEKLKDMLTEFKIYCSPLVVSTLIGFLYSFADYWLLQKFGGAIEQGYYAIGMKFTSIVLIVTTSMLAVFWKEIAEANARKNKERVYLLYRRISKGLYFVGAVLSCFIIPFSSEILSLLLGPAYSSAWLVLAIILLYPVHQSLGQITGTMLYATGQTKAYSRIAVFFMAISIPVAYFLLAQPTSLVPGLGLGAIGLAIKMVICQLTGVNLMAFFVAKYLNRQFSWYFQISILLLLLPLGFLSKFLSQCFLSFVSLSTHPLLVLFFSGIIYSAGVLVLFYIFPSLAGIDKTQLSRGFIWIRNRFSLS